MLYHSTHNPAHRVDLKEAILRSLRPNNGLQRPDPHDVFVVKDESFKGQGGLGS
jgi:hypothetical protein